MTEQTSRNQQACRRRHWQAHVKALKQSGLDRAEYGRQHNLSYHALSYWHRKLSGPGSGKATLVPVTFGDSIGQKTVQPDRAALKIILPGRLSIEVGDHFSPATLTRLLATLEGR